MSESPATAGAPTVVVVGAGISGLAAAHHLLTGQPRLHVVVLDAAPRVGGKLAALDLAGLTLDGGAEALLARRPEAVDLARAVGLADDLVSPTTTSARVWSRGALAPLPAGTLMGIPAWSRDATGVLHPAEAAAIDAEPDRPATPVEDDVDVASYVASRVGRPVVERLVEPLLGGVYAGHADRLSLRATLPAVWEVAHRGGSLVEAGRARTAAAGEPVAPVFAGIRGGVARLPVAVRAEVERLGGEVRTGVTVRGVRHGGEGGPSWRLETGSRAEPAELSADAVLLAVPARPASRLLATVSAPVAAALGRVESASMAVITAVLPGMAPAVEGRGSGFLVPPVEGRLVKAATYSSAKWGWLAAEAGDALVVRLSIGREGEEADLQRPDAELTTAALAELAVALGRPLPEPVGASVTRWGGGLPQYAVGHVDLVATVRAAVDQVPGLAVCGAYLDGLGVPACIAAGRRAAEELLSGLPSGPLAGERTMEP